MSIPKCFYSIKVLEKSTSDILILPSLQACAGVALDQSSDIWLHSLSLRKSLSESAPGFLPKFKNMLRARRLVS